MSAPLLGGCATTVAAEPMKQSVSVLSARADPGAGLDNGRAVQLGTGQQNHVGLQSDADVHPGRRRVNHGHAGVHPAGQQPPVPARPGSSASCCWSLIPRDQPRVRAAQRADPASVGVRHAEHVGQVELALCVRVRGGHLRQPGQRPAQQVRLEHVDAGVELGDGQLEQAWRRAARRCR